MIKNIYQIVLVTIAINYSPILPASNLFSNKVADEQLFALDEQPVLGDRELAQSSIKVDRVSQRGYRWLKQVLKTAKTNDDFVNLAAVYLFAQENPRNYGESCGLVWVACMIPAGLSAPFTMGIGFVFFAPAVGVTIHFGIKYHKYKKLKRHAKQLLIDMDQATFNEIVKANSDGDLTKLGKQKIIQYQNDRLKNIGIKEQNIQTYSDLYEGLKCLLSRRGYDVSNAIIW